MKIRNPRNGTFDYELLENSPEEIKEKTIRLRANQKAWQTSGIESRVKVLLSLAEGLEKSRESIIEQLSIDTGRRKISQIEFDGVIGLIKGRCFSSPKLIQAEDTRQSFTNPNVTIQQQLVPYEVVGVISPWNFPLLLALIDSVPALLAGSAVLLKSSEVTPRFLDPFEQVVLSIPELAHVLSIVRGAATAGKELVNNVDVVCFTGSVPTGKMIAARCAERFIPAFLELGGKDPAIILADADLELCTDSIIRSCAGATGQACQSLERIYVDENIKDVFTAMLVEKCKKIRFNNDYSNGGTLGPLIFDKQAEKIQSQIQSAVDNGARLLFGGELHNIDGGLWLMPTVLDQVTHQMEIMRDETFGPVIPIMSFSTADEAIRLANDSEFGLSASVYSSNIEQAITVANQIDAGGISINDGSLTNQVYDATKNSFKSSGLHGSRMGDDGFTRFFRKKALLIQNGTPQSIHSQDEDVALT